MTIQGFNNKKKTKIIDIAIPVLDEEKFLKECIESVLEFSIPENTSVAIYIIDGGSQDQTLKIAESYSNNYDNIKVLHNEKKIASAALNIAINLGEGDYFLRLDAHSIYPSDYLFECYKTMIRTNAANVGGLAITEPGDHSYSAALVQALTTHWFGVGDSGFRTNAKEGPSDTVPYGFFDKQIFKKIGLFDERLVRAQDYEMNNRIIKNNGLVWLNPKIFFHYKNQSSLFHFYKKQITKEAPYNAYMWWVAPTTFTPRHAITGVFTIGFLGGIFLSPLTNLILLPFLAIMSLYLLLALLAGFKQSIKYNYFSHILLLPLCFFPYHFLHGIGLLWGCFMLLIKKSPVQKAHNVL